MPAPCYRGLAAYRSFCASRVIRSLRVLQLHVFAWERPAAQNFMATARPCAAAASGSGVSATHACKAMAVKAIRSQHGRGQGARRLLFRPLARLNPQSAWTDCYPAAALSCTFSASIRRACLVVFMSDNVRLSQGQPAPLHRRR